MSEPTYEYLSREENLKFMRLGFAMTPIEQDEAYSLPSRGTRAEPSQFTRYIKMRVNDNQSHNMAMILATRSFPGIKTDAIFNEGRHSGNQFAATPAQGDYLKKIAESAGVSVTGKTYMKGLARYPGDPMAWINGRHDVHRVAEANGMQVHGYVEHKSHEREPMPDVDIDPRLVHAETRDILESHPGSRYADVYERVHEFRTGKIDNNPLIVQE